MKLGVDASQEILRSGANDFGGTLMEETISRMAGAGWGIGMTPAEFDDAIRAIGRTPGVRTTTYERIERESRFLTAIRQVWLTIFVIPVDHRVSSRKGLHPCVRLGTIVIR